MKNVILAAVNSNKSTLDVNQSLIELEELANACGYEVVGTITQNLDHINNALYFNRGKLDELKLMVEASGADTVIFDDELSSIQQRNIDEILDLEVIDRTYLILEIFATRAKTKEAILQVEVAKLKYEMPRLIGQNIELYSQQGGKGFRGSGEQKLELQKRELKAKIVRIEKELLEMAKNRQTQRSLRDSMAKVALVGYTNAGKSTILNELLNSEDKRVLAEDMLFATLETSTRRISKENYPAIVLTDTVGFVAKLPHNLVKAFRSTLEEVLEADLLVHVVDVSNPNYLQQMQTTNEVLKEIGSKDQPMLYVFNKLDKAEGEIELTENSLAISAHKYEDIELLKTTIFEQVFLDFELVTLDLSYNDLYLVDYLKANSIILDLTNHDNGMYLTLRLNPRDLNKFKAYIVDKDQ